MGVEKFAAIPGTDLKLFKLGYGAVDAGGSVSDAMLESCLAYYLDRGGNVLDTARVYTAGQSEMAIGRYFDKHKNRDKFVLITKGGHPPLSDLHHSRLSVNEVGSDLDLSLQSLKTDHVDIYFLHRDDESKPVGELIEMLEGFVKAGKIRYYGCSNFSAKRMKEADEYALAHGYRGFVANEMFYNIASDRMNPFPDDTLGVMDNDMQQYHATTASNLAMPYFSVCSGFFHKLAKNPNDASLRESPYYTEGNLKVFEKMKEVAAKYNASLSQVMLGFYSVRKYQSVPLFGTSKVPNLEDAMGYLDFDFKLEDFEL